MFVPKTSSQQKRGKKMQECETGGSALCNSPLRVTLLAIASKLQGAPAARIQLASRALWRVMTVQSRENLHFHPRPQF